MEENQTEIATGLKDKMEEKSGVLLEDVRVHYNSDKSKQVEALAYTPGDQVYIGPGQEQHLNHKMDHVVQQKQGTRERSNTWQSI